MNPQRQNPAVPLVEIAANREAYPWFPSRAVVAESLNGQVSYREAIPPEMPAPPPPGDMPPECVSLTELNGQRERYPWFPDAAVTCGEFEGVEYFKPAEGGDDQGGGGGGDYVGGRENQPHGDVDDVDAPPAYLDPALDDLEGFDPE